MAPRPLEISEEQALWFRARRGHLAGPGAASAAAAVRAVLGVQAQQLPTGLQALSLRTRGHPAAGALAAELLEAPRSLVHTWGQRDTLHLYDPQAHWALVVAARPEWTHGSRRGVMPGRRLVARARRRLEAADGPLTRSDLFDLVPADLLAEAEEKMGEGMPAVRLVAGRLLWSLALAGEAAAAGNAGAEKRFAARSAWFPELAWPEPLPRSADAAASLARDYLAAYGPATARDVAHFFGARLASARGWLATLAEEAGLVAVRCGERRLTALAADRAALAEKPPRRLGDWPVRLLPLWDCLLMGHADKSWTVPDQSERPLVWRKAAYVSAVVLDRGRVVATWSHRARARKLALAVEPLSGWRPRRHAASVRREARRLAAHLELPEVEVALP